MRKGEQSASGQIDLNQFTVKQDTQTQKSHQTSGAQSQKGDGDENMDGNIPQTEVPAPKVQKVSSPKDSNRLQGNMFAKGANDLTKKIVTGQKKDIFTDLKGKRPNPFAQGPMNNKVKKLS